MRGVDRDVERLLHRMRPRPRPEFVHGLEESLLEDVPAERPRDRRRVVLASAALTGGLATALAVLGLTGMLPLGLGDADSGEAGQRCRTVTVERVIRNPRLVVGPSGELTLRYSTTRVRQAVERCGDRPRSPAARGAGAEPETGSGTRSPR
jgi:hypothetical protein